MGKGYDMMADNDADPDDYDDEHQDDLTEEEYENLKLIAQGGTGVEEPDEDEEEDEEDEEEEGGGEEEPESGDILTRMAAEDELAAIKDPATDTSGGLYPELSEEEEAQVREEHPEILEQEEEPEERVSRFDQGTTRRYLRQRQPSPPERKRKSHGFDYPSMRGMRGGYE